MAKLSPIQLRILKILLGTSGWLTRNEMKAHPREKGYSEALGAPTRGEPRQGSLEQLNYVERLDRKQPFKYRITEFGKHALAEYEREHGEIQLLSLAESALAEVAEELDEEGEFDPNGIEDARKKTLRAIVLRQGQPKFRKKLLQAYGGRFAITGCSVNPVLEAAHIIPYQGEKTNHPSNGILLRADFHTLFDRQLISIDQDTMKLLVS